MMDVLTDLHWLTFDGKSTKDFGVYLVGNAVYNAPEREYEKVSIPGRSGDLLIDNNRYKNIEIPYEAIVYQAFPCNIDGLRNYLLSKQGYFRLEDTYHPEEYRMARYAGGLELTGLKYPRMGRVVLRFDCKPQRYLKNGERAHTFTAAGTLYNPTRMEARPLVRVYGKGAVGVGANTITITAADGYTDIDCELQDAYKGAANCNGNITLNSGAFFALAPGTNGVTLGRGVTKVEITPRWWKI